VLRQADTMLAPNEHSTSGRFLDVTIALECGNQKIGEELRTVQVAHCWAPRFTASRRSLLGNTGPGSSA
jgi:hypothetical protein